MGRKGLIALAGLAVLFFALSELIGDGGDEGILSRLAGSSASEPAQDEGSENVDAEPASPDSEEILDEVPAEPDDDFGGPIDDENLIADDEAIDPATGFNPSPNIAPSGPENGPSGSGANPGIEAARPNEALMRDLAKAGIIEEPRKPR